MSLNGVVALAAGSVSRWRSPLLACGLAVAALLVMFAPTFGAMVTIWSRSDTFAHGYLVAPISLWLIWRLKDPLAQLTPKPALRWVGVLVACAVMWLLGDVAGVNAMTQLAAVGMLVSALVAVLGTTVARAIAFPLAFLFFMVPIGDFLMPVLMARTADVTVWVIKAVGIPVYRDGLQFVIPSGTWSVVEACSGVRYLIASFMVGSLFAYLNYSSTKRRIVFAIVSLIVPVVANWGRAVMIVMLGHFSGNTLAVGVDHLIYGWVFFGVVVMVMFAIGARWSEPEVLPALPGSRGDAALVRPAPALVAWLPVLAAVVVSGLFPRWAAHRLTDQGVETPLVLTAPALDGMPQTTTDIDYRPSFQQPTASVEQAYGSAAGTGPVTLHVAYYRRQAYGHKLVASSNMMVKSDDPRWHRTASGEHEVQVAGAPVNLRTAEIRGGSVAGALSDTPRLHVRQVLWVDGHLTASDSQAVLRGLQSQFAARGDDAAAITWFVQSADPTAAQVVLDRFAQTQLPAIGRWLAQARASRQP
jgi:exosortase A